MPATPPLDLDAELRARFALTGFRPWQREAVEALLSPEPGARAQVLVVAPTGGGKSLTYQFPASVLPGLTVVVSPLVALMEDQVRALEARGIPATLLASHLDQDERRARVNGARAGKYKLLYCAPERLAYDAFVEELCRCDVSLVAIDEAHCIAQWGHDFRPDYLRIGEVVARIDEARAARGLEPVRVLACTATATPRVRDEIVARLSMPEAKVLVRGFARPNLHLAARSVDGKKQAKQLLDEALASAIGTPKSPKGTAIVYCATRKATEQLRDDLKKAGWNAAAYHAGLDSDLRAEVNAAFAMGKLSVVVATNAFGMGIDRADVRVVVHAQPPASLEAYYQEVGRAGRDGDEAHGLLLCSGSDVAIRRRLCESGQDGPAPAELAARQWALFRELLRYLDAGSCRHDFILRYFGDEREVLGGCGHCDVCAELDDREATPETATDEAAVEIRKALAAVARAKRRGGLVAIAEMLRGEKNERIERFGFDQLTTFGVLKERSQPWILALLRALLGAGWIDLSTDEHPVPFITTAGWQVMTSAGPVRLRLPSEESPAKKSERGGRARAALAVRSGSAGKKADPSLLSAESARLFDLLRAHRAELAKQRNVPAYVIAHDATLVDMAMLRPRNETELLAVKGMGPYRVETYGDGFLSAIRSAT